MTNEDILIRLESMSEEERRILLESLKEKPVRKPVKKKVAKPRAVPITEGISKGGQNPPNISGDRPPAPQGSGGKAVKKAKKTPPKKRGRPKKAESVKAAKPKSQKISTAVKTKRKKGDNKAEKQKKMCMMVPMEIIENRPNLFEQSSMFKEHKDDSKIDKILTKNVGRTPRTKRSNRIDDVVCRRCEYIFDNVNISLCYQSDGEWNFICDDCGSAGR